MEWITLREYSRRYKISVSILENKIRLGQIEYIFTAGVYKLRNLPLFEQSSFKEKVFFEDMENKIKKLKTLLDVKNKELSKLKASYEDLKNLASWLEKDNQRLKDLIVDFRKLDQWLRETEISPSI